MFERCGTLLLGLLLAALSLPLAGAGQEVPVAQARRGWIGISFDYAMTADRGVRRTVAVVSEVVRGSPAERAGIQAGDTLTHLDGRPVSPEAFNSLVQSLDPGDLVRMTVRRGGREREILVEAGTRPLFMSYALGAPDVGAVVIHLDSVRGAIIRNLDSLRLAFAPRPGDTARTSDIRMFLRGGEEVRPLEFTLVRSPALDSLREEERSLRTRINQLRQGELALVRELQRSRRALTEAEARQDPEVRRVREEEEALVARQRALSEEIRGASEEESKRLWAQSQARWEEAMAQARRAQAQLEAQLREAPAASRLTAPLLLGQSFVGGAQVTPLNPALAEYFQVRRGLLVTEVVAGTPAAESGLRAGDVIVRVDGEEVSSLDDLRFRLGYFQRPLRLGIVRKGEHREIVLGR